MMARVVGTGAVHHRNALLPIFRLGCLPNRQGFSRHKHGAGGDDNATIFLREPQGRGERLPHRSEHAVRYLRGVGELGDSLRRQCPRVIRLVMMSFLTLVLISSNMPGMFLSSEAPKTR